MQKYITTLSTLSSRFDQCAKKSDQPDYMKGFLVKIERGFNGFEQTRQSDPQGASNDLKKLAYAVQDELAVESSKISMGQEKALRKAAGFTDKDGRNIHSPFGPELRAQVRLLSPGKRVSSVQAFIKAEDSLSLNAVLSAPTLLTCLSDDEISKARDQYYSIKAPTLVEAREAHRKRHEIVEAAIKTALSAAREATDGE